ncbi:hypothetical protein AKJ62_01240 [candidate division MSBL1 archaeon SCGC-AAA259D14]|uniref:Uncharacterized protein n=1 Tax=candidate division MSBL1 archaeon SCGC-AAA259D14 TaxID=1698261 RepID=A0A133U7U3_9EURY|nr:hypothetical protein AKJ62_01240 [candidate division MSBL1 archaeon SCGC-AAA259D14]
MSLPKGEDHGKGKAEREPSIWWESSSARRGGVAKLSLYFLVLRRTMLSLPSRRIPHPNQQSQEFLK